jgi:hypothetical protein
MSLKARISYPMGDDCYARRGSGNVRHSRGVSDVGLENDSISGADPTIIHIAYADWSRS